MDAVIIDKAQALELLEQVVAERGRDYVYPKAVCVYSENGEPSCGVGFAISIAAPDAFTEIVRYELRSATSFAASDLELVDDENFSHSQLIQNEVEGVRFTHEASDVMESFQSQQDRRGVYGVILDEIKSTYYAE